MRVRVAISTAVILCAPLGACSACDTHPTNDGGTDAAVKDAPKESGGDVAIPDGGDGDDAFNPFIGTWSPLAGATPKCGVKIDQTPDKDISAFTWQACKSGQPGCSRLVVDWTSNLGVQIAFPWRVVKPWKSGTPLIAYTRAFPEAGQPNTTLAYIDVVSDLQGHAVWASGSLSGPGYCAGQVTPSSSGVDLALLDTDLTLILAHAPYLQPAQVVTHLHSQADLGMLAGPTGGAIQRSVANASLLFCDTSEPFSLSLYEPITDAVTLVSNDAGRIPAEFPVAVDGGAIAIDTSNSRGVFYVASDGTNARVYVPQNSDQVFAIDADNTNSDTFVWMQGQLLSLDYTNVSLWKAAYATSAGALQASRVTGVATMFNDGNFMVANAGFALLQTSATTVELVRLSDGWGWSIDADTGDYWGKMLWVDANEVWVAVGPAANQGYFTTGIVRQQIASLGAPTIAPN